MVDGSSRVPPFQRFNNVIRNTNYNLGKNMKEIITTVIFLIAVIIGLYFLSENFKNKEAALQEKSNENQPDTTTAEKKMEEGKLLI